jgi:rare lipoprotein A
MRAFSFSRPAFVVSLAALLIGVQQIPVASAQEFTRGGATTETLVKLPIFESGIASTYGSGDGFEGERTACGQIFRTAVIQVAHKSLPCGTVIRVEDTDTGKSIQAEVTDRGPYVTGRIVDLSWAAFSTLEPSAPGLIHVNVYVIDTSNQYDYRLR